MIILAVDPGQRRIGLAITDPSGKVALPLMVIPHNSRQIDAARIVQIASENLAELILVGQALDSNNLPTLQSRRSENLTKAIQILTPIPVKMWEEYRSSQTIRDLMPKPSKKRKQREKPIDAIAAVVILQNYLENQPEEKNE